MHLHYDYFSKTNLKVYLNDPFAQIGTCKGEQPERPALITQCSTELLGSNEHYSCVKQESSGMPAAM